VPAVLTSSASPATWRPAPGLPSPGGCAPSRGSAATRSKKNSSITHPPLTSGAHGWITSHATALDRNELGTLLLAAGLGPPAEHALISLQALNELRVSEATGADIEALGTERGHRTLVVTRKGGKVVTIPLAPRTARAIDLAIGERCAGPVFLALRRDRPWQPRSFRLATCEPARRTMKITSTNELQRDATKREQHKPHEPPYLHPPVTATVRYGVRAVVVALVQGWLSLLPVPDSC
jgi:integrase